MEVDLVVDAAGVVELADAATGVVSS